MAFMLRDAEKVTSSSDRFVHPGRRNTLLRYSVVQTGWFANRKVRGAERGSNPSGYPIDMASRQCPVLAGSRHVAQFNSSSFQYLVPLTVACSASPLSVN